MAHIHHRHTSYFKLKIATRKQAFVMLSLFGAVAGDVNGDLMVMVMECGEN